MLNEMMSCFCSFAVNDFQSHQDSQVTCQHDHVAQHDQPAHDQPAALGVEWIPVGSQPTRS